MFHRPHITLEVEAGARVGHNCRGRPEAQPQARSMSGAGSSCVVMLKASVGASRAPARGTRLRCHAASAWAARATPHCWLPASVGRHPTWISPCCGPQAAALRPQRRNATTPRPGNGVSPVRASSVPRGSHTAQPPRAEAPAPLAQQPEKCAALRHRHTALHRTRVAQRESPR